MREMQLFLVDFLILVRDVSAKPDYSTVMDHFKELQKKQRSIPGSMFQFLLMKYFTADQEYSWDRVIMVRAIISSTHCEMYH